MRENRHSKHIRQSKKSGTSKDAKEKKDSEKRFKSSEGKQAKAKDLKWKEIPSKKNTSREKTEDLTSNRESEFQLPALKIVNVGRREEVSEAVQKLDRWIQADELPGPLVLKLTRDVIKLERGLREERIINAIQQRRREYDLIRKEEILRHRIPNSFVFTTNKETSRRGFSYFPSFIQNGDKRVSSKESIKFPYGATVNEKRLYEHQELALKRMKEFGQRYRHSNGKHLPKIDNKHRH